MIVKKIPARRDSRHAGTRRAKHVRDLVDYMRSPEKESSLRDYLVTYMASQGLHDGPERLIQLGARNFVCEDLEGQRAEMMAVAQAAVRTRNPIDHWLLSWREGEFPSAEQVDETIDIFVKELGLSAHQCIFAVHGDTHNRHIHIALNRYNPVTGKVVTINKGFYKEAAHKAVARIVDRFGWTPEAEARYLIENGEPVLSDAATARKEAGKASISNAAAAFEVRTGYRSVQRIAQAEAVPIILAARSWAELHAGLANIGITYEVAGSNGAVLTIGEEGVRSSQVSRRISRTGLERRLGQFRPRASELRIAPRPPEVDRFPEAFRADEYREIRRQWDAADKTERTGLQRPAANFEAWLHEEGETWIAEQWRKRGPRLDDLCSFEGSPATEPGGVGTIRGFQPYECCEGIRYARDGEGTAFIDRGDRITVLTEKSDEALLAALELAIHKFDGKVRIKGNKQIRRQIEAIAERYGLEHCIIPEHDGTKTNEAHRGPSIASKVDGVTAATQREKAALGTAKNMLRDVVRRLESASDQKGSPEPPAGSQAAPKQHTAESREAAMKRLQNMAKGPQTPDQSQLGPRRRDIGR
jgi:MobA/VirD2-like, nuclease domain/TraI-like middle domain/Large polyvalent protein-associated domain 7